MFHFPASTPTQAMHSPAGNTTQLMLGFPIRTSSDQRLVGNSPRLNAASHVLHRPSMPRHPPYARNTKQHTAASHIRTTTNCRHSTNNTNYRKTRCSRPLYSSHTTHTPHQQPPQQAVTSNGMPQTQEHTMLPQTPNSMPTHPKTIFCHRETLGVTPHEHTHTRPQADTLMASTNTTRGVCPPGIFNQTMRQSHTRRHQPHNTHNCGQK